MFSKLRNFWFTPTKPCLGEHLSIHLIRLFEQLQINCVFDIGASRGQYGHLLRSVGYHGEIFSFEPTPSDFSVLLKNSASDPRWHVQQLALGDENGHLDLNIFNDTVFNSFMEPNDYILSLGPKVARKEKVLIARLDDIFSSLMTNINEPRVFLKIDTQGYDQFVLRGANDTLSEVLALQTEVSVHPIYQNVPTYLEAIDHLNSLQFNLTGLFPVSRDEHLRIVEFDCVMVRSSAVGDFGSLQAP